MQRQVAVALLLVYCSIFVNSASVGVVRVPRVYNVLIRSDGALAPSEAVSADSGQSLSNDETSIKDESHQEDEEENDEVDGAEENQQGEEIEKEDPLPILDPKMGAIQDGVNYTAVPLSRAYPLTRYTAPIIAAHYPISYLSPLHGGLILGPVPRLPASLQQQQQQYQQQVPQEEERTDLGSVPSLQSSVYDSPPRQQRQQQSSALPTGAFEDYDRDSVAVEAEDDQQQN